MKKMLGCAVLSVLSIIFLAGSAHADVLGAAARDSFSVTLNSTPTFIALDDAGNTSITVSTASTQTIAVLFKADCNVVTAGDFVYIEIYIDNVLATGNAAGPSRFCSSTSPAAHEHNAFATVSAGNHTIRVSSYTVNSAGGAGGTGRLRRIVTLVQN